MRALIVCMFVFLLLGEALAVETREKADTWEFETDFYILQLPQGKGTFTLLIKGSMGTFPIHSPRGEGPWFGYNSPGGEIRTSARRPEKVKVSKKRQYWEIEVTTPLEKGVYHRGFFYLWEDFLAIRSLIEGKTTEEVNIVRLAPRMEVDLGVFTDYAFSIPKRIVAGKAKDLGRPGYAGISAWGGPQSYASLDPSAPFLALYNPELKTGFLFLYPFYKNLWLGKHIFLQRWHEIDYFYAGWGDKSSLGEEVLFLIAPLKAYSAEEIYNQARELTERVERLVLEGFLPFPSFLRSLKVEEEIEKNRKKCEEKIRGILNKVEGLPPRQLETVVRHTFQIQLLTVASQIALSQRDYDKALSYSRRMVESLANWKEDEGK